MDILWGCQKLWAKARFGWLAANPGNNVGVSRIYAG